MSGNDIFAVGRGQYENIGDVILRRPLLNWARAHGRLHVYVGRSPAGYDASLGVGGDDVVYRSLRRWYLALLRSAWAGRAHSVYKPGEIQLTLVGMKEHILMLPAAALVRLRGGTVNRIGVGARNFSAIPRAIMWPSNALSSYSQWRDDDTAAYLRCGGSMPDLGFAEGMTTAELVAAASDTHRDVMVVSLRNDVEVAPRPYPTPDWFEGITAFARERGLELWVVTQVSVDDSRSRRLAADLGARLLSWPDATDHAAQEERLRALYRRTLVAASDRLHVVIAAFTEGAAPVGLQLDDSGKIASHFATIGIEGISVNTTGMAPEALAAALGAFADRRAEMLDRLVDARARLETVRMELDARLSSEPPTEAAVV